MPRLFSLNISKERAVSQHLKDCDKKSGRVQKIVFSNGYKSLVITVRMRRKKKNYINNLISARHMSHTKILLFGPLDPEYCNDWSMIGRLNAKDMLLIRIIRTKTDKVSYRRRKQRSSRKRPTFLVAQRPNQELNLHCCLRAQHSGALGAFLF